MRQIFVHLHIPKCGGSTVVNLLARNFGKGLINTNSVLNDYQYDAAQITRIIQHFPQLTCLTGHKLSLDLPYDREDLDLQAFTFIRDPIDRFVSHYFFLRNHREYVPEAKTMDLLEYTEWALKHENQKMYINGQTKFLGKGSLETIRSMVDAQKLMLFPLEEVQAAFYTLANRFPDAFRDVRIKSKNISRKDQALPDGFRELVQPYVEKDLQLLELARQTALDREPAHRPRRLPDLGSGEKWRNVALRTARFMHRVAGFIEKRYR